MHNRFECAQETYAKKVLRETGLKAMPQRLAVVHVLNTSGKSLSVGEMRDGRSGVGVSAVAADLT